MAKAGIWLRVSTDRQDAENQRAAVERYCADHGYTVEREYKLDGKSAYKGKQDPQWQRVLDDFRSGTILVLVIWAGDRLERRGIEATFARLREAQEAGGRIESVQESWLGQDDMGEMMTAFAGFSARQESARKSERIKAAQAELRRGGHLANRIPWGYRSVGERRAHTIEPTDECRRLWPEVCQRIIDGESLRTVCRWLETETGEVWWPRTLGRLIRDKTYAGRHMQGRSKLPGDYAVIDDRTRRQAEKALRSAPRNKGGRKSKSPALMSGLIVCAQPGCDATGEHPSPMYRVNGYGGEVYRCHGRGAQRKGCGFSAPVAEVDKGVGYFASKLTFKVTTWQTVPGTNWESEIARVAEDIRELDPLAEDYDDSLAKLRAELADYRARPVVPDTRVPVEAEQSYAERWDSAEDSARRDLIREWRKDAGLTWSCWREGDGMLHVVAKL